MHRAVSRVLGHVCTLAVLSVATTLLAGAPPAGAGAPSPTGQRAGATHRGAPVRARIIFDKDTRHPFASRLLWRAWQRRADGTWRLVDHAAWRAGSGFGGPDTTHECVRGRGWLPDGRYSFVQYDDYRGNLIKGRAFYLGDKRCHNGTPRSDLFIHTETGAHNRQCANRRGDQLCRWEWPRINDYRSEGCIKMAPHDLLALTRRYHRWFAARVRYPMARVQVVVHG